LVLCSPLTPILSSCSLLSIQQIVDFRGDAQRKRQNNVLYRRPFSLLCVYRGSIAAPVNTSVQNGTSALSSLSSKSCCTGLV
jgi:hypothetical protein